RALELARTLQAARPGLGDAAPLLLITTATLDDVLQPDDPLGATSFTAVYDRRTFRFCFTNRQMAEGVSDFLWSQDDLRPDPDPMYVVAWQDDPYSVDLAGRFREIAWKRREARAAGRDKATPTSPSSRTNNPHR